MERSPDCSNAKRRQVGGQGAVLKPRDMAVYLERTWHLYVPGFGSDQIKPYRLVGGWVCDAATVATSHHALVTRVVWLLVTGVGMVCVCHSPGCQLKHGFICMLLTH